MHSGLREKGAASRAMPQGVRTELAAPRKCGDRRRGQGHKPPDTSPGTAGREASPGTPAPEAPGHQPRDSRARNPRTPAPGHQLRDTSPRTAGRTAPGAARDRTSPLTAAGAHRSQRRPGAAQAGATGSPGGRAEVQGGGRMPGVCPESEHGRCGASGARGGL